MRGDWSHLKISCSSSPKVLDKTKGICYNGRLENSMNKFISRKLLMALASIAAILLGDYSVTGSIHSETIMAAAGIAVTYMVAQGWVDSKEKPDA